MKSASWKVSNEKCQMKIDKKSSQWKVPDEEWKLLDQMCPIKVFYENTQISA